MIYCLLPPRLKSGVVGLDLRPNNRVFRGILPHCAQPHTPYFRLNMNYFKFPSRTHGATSTTSASCPHLRASPQWPTDHGNCFVLHCALACLPCWLGSFSRCSGPSSPLHCETTTPTMAAFMPHLDCALARPLPEYMSKCRQYPSPVQHKLIQDAL